MWETTYQFFQVNLSTLNSSADVANNVVHVSPLQNRHFPFVPDDICSTNTNAVQAAVDIVNIAGYTDNMIKWQ